MRKKRGKFVEPFQLTRRQMQVAALFFHTSLTIREAYRKAIIFIRLHSWHFTHFLLDYLTPRENEKRTHIPLQSDVIGLSKINWSSLGLLINCDTTSVF